MFQQFLDKVRNDMRLDQTPNLRTSLPIRVAWCSRIPNPLVRCSHHFGPTPIGHVARRNKNKTTKRVRLTNGNLVLDLPVPPKLVLLRVGHPEVRYTAVTFNPDDFIPRPIPLLGLNPPHFLILQPLPFASTFMVRQSLLYCP
jgi:Chitin synthase N-terminal